MADKKRLIDANALLEKLKRTSRYFDIKFDIDEAPTVDAVEVVRCKDCKHYKTIQCSCGCHCVSDDWYCADGERKDNERKVD